ncbi:MAG TPA: AraC family transcriptional regulator [Armatimonadota bacterium]|jgi:iron complex transport system substrate-binding protein
MGEVFQHESAHLLSIGHLLPDASWQMATHSHAHWEFIYFLHGCGRVELPHAKLHPQQYYLMVYPPGLPHAEVADPIEPEETVFISIDVEGIPPHGAHLLLPDQYGEMRWIAEHLLAETMRRGISPLAETYTRTFLCLVERAWEDSVPVAHDLADLAVQFLHAHYAEHLTLATLAQEARVSESHLVHRFRARVGMSPMRYLLALRMDAAQGLLLTTDLPVQDIAAQVGFPDPFYFTRLFKRHTGHAPSAFRQQKRKAESSRLATTDSMV